jgi:SAM-dependent methyltransferase
LIFKKSSTGYFYPENGFENNISYPDIGNEDCYQIEEHSQWFNARNKNIDDVLKNYPFKDDFLDVGGGNGFQLRYLQNNYFKEKNIRSALCEPGTKGCVNAATRGVSNVYNCMFQEFPFHHFQVGGVGLFDVLEHIENDVDFLKEISSFLPSGGKIYITVPALKYLWSSEDDFAGHYRRFNKNETKRISDETGLKIVFQTYFFSYYVPLVYLLRVLPEKLGKTQTIDQIREKEMNYHKTSSLLNGVLNFFHWIELV